MKKVLMIILTTVASATTMAQQKVQTSTESPKFILIFRYKADVPAPSPDQIKASGEKWGQWMGALAQQGKLIGGEQIGSGGTTITGTKKDVASNPVVANKEIVTGYLLVNAKDLKEAETVAKDCPILSFNGSVEIRQIQPQN